MSKPLNLPLSRRAANRAVWTGFIGVFCVDLIQFILPEINNVNNAFGFAEYLTSFLLLYLFVGLPLAFTIGFPVSTLILRSLNKRHLLTAHHCILSGMVFGNALWITLGLVFEIQHSTTHLVVDGLSTIMIGGVAGFVAYCETTKAHQPIHG